MNRLLLLVALALSLLLFGLGPGADAETECAAYCETYWASDSAQYQRCIENCGR